ncbi:low affinity iron permease family protein [Cupriavidus malaysiensis]|uniref:low affinity iron permease family protein n=1 Tax=Cupriavidus malaysiensis TaxID=367825 RepID=UPI000A046F5E|nr:low affinity iron permease family protein [Cupriavidus malaysiensis]
MRIRQPYWVRRCVRVCAGLAGHRHHGPAEGAASPGQTFDRVSRWATGAAGSSWAFIAALGATLLWGAVAPIFHYSDAWQLVANTVTNVITFLMVFLIQQSQNRDSIALHLKLDELLASSRGASMNLVAIEELDEASLTRLADYYRALALEAKRGAAPGPEGAGA